MFYCLFFVKIISGTNLQRKALVDKPLDELTVIAAASFLNLIDNLEHQIFNVTTNQFLVVVDEISYFIADEVTDEFAESFIVQKSSDFELKQKF